MKGTPKGDIYILTFILKEKQNKRNKELKRCRYTATTVHPESQVWVFFTQ